MHMARKMQHEPAPAPRAKRARQRHSYISVEWMESTDADGYVTRRKMYIAHHYDGTRQFALADDAAAWLATKRAENKRPRGYTSPQAYTKKIDRIEGLLDDLEQRNVNGVSIGASDAHHRAYEAIRELRAIGGEADK
jgi:hypothetical protein